MDNYSLGSLIYEEDKREELIRIVTDVEENKNQELSVLKVRNLNSNHSYQILRGYSRIYPIPFTLENFKRYLNIYPIWRTQNGWFYFSEKFQLSINFIKDRDIEGNQTIKDFSYNYCLKKVKYIHEFQNLLMGLGFNPLYFENIKKEMNY